MGIESFKMVAPSFTRHTSGKVGEVWARRWRRSKGKQSVGHGSSLAGAAWFSLAWAGNKCMLCYQCYDMRPVRRAQQQQQR